MSQCIKNEEAPGLIRYDEIEAGKFFTVFKSNKLYLKLRNDQCFEFGPDSFDIFNDDTLVQRVPNNEIRINWNF